MGETCRSEQSIEKVSTQGGGMTCANVLPLRVILVILKTDAYYEFESRHW